MRGPPRQEPVQSGYGVCESGRWRKLCSALQPSAILDQGGQQDRASHHGFQLRCRVICSDLGPRSVGWAVFSAPHVRQKLPRTESAWCPFRLRNFGSVPRKMVRPSAAGHCGAVRPIGTLRRARPLEWMSITIGRISGGYGELAYADQQIPRPPSLGTCSARHRSGTRGEQCSGQPGLQCNPAVDPLIADPAASARPSRELWGLEPARWGTAIASEL